MKKQSYQEASICWNNIETFLWDVTMVINEKWVHSIATAESLLSPLDWYIKTGRASCNFLRRMVTADKNKIARALCLGGSTEEAMKRVKTVIGYESTC